MFYGLELRLRLAISRAMRSVAGGICLAVGAVFLTIAGWIALVDAYDALTAALAIGGGYFLLGIILLLSTRFRRAYAPPPCRCARSEARLRSRCSCKHHVCA